MNGDNWLRIAVDPLSYNSPKMKPADILIVGSGVIGLFCARELAMAGFSVTLLDRAEVGRESSWAGGGIVSPLYPWRYPPAVTSLAMQAQAAYPLLAAELLKETGIDPELEPCGMLVLDAPDVRDALVWSHDRGRWVERLDAAMIERRFQGLAKGFADGLWWPDQANVRNPRLVAALRASVLTRGVVIREQAEVAGLLQQGEHVCGVELAGGERLSAAHVVIASGAWSGGLLQGVGGWTLPVEPVKGQMLLFKTPPGWLPCMVMHQGKYLIPRRDGHVLVGSTLEYQGFDKTVTTGAREDLLAAALAMVPALAEWPLVQQWAGLRPGSPSGIPFIGAVPGVKNLWLNSGHFRNGLVLAPASARLLVDLMTGSEPCVDPAPYQVIF